MLELRPYQHLAVRYLQERRRAALFLDMGLGKTATCLRALTPDRLPALVVAPRRVAEEVWPVELPKWRPDLTFTLAAGSAPQRARALKQPADVTIIGRDNQRDVEAMAKSGRFATLIIDELSGYKARSSVRWRSAKKIVPHVENVWGLTGSPSPNGFLDLWAQAYLLDGGKRLETTLGGYRSRYFTPGRQLANGTITSWDIRPGAADKIMAKLEDIALAMGTDGRVELPDVTVNTVTVPLPPAVRKLYRTMKNDLVVDLDVLGGEVHTAKNAAVLSGKLAQITAGGMYVDEADLRGGAYDVLHREKTRAALEIIDGTGSPVLVFYRFAFERDLLLQALPDRAHTIDEPGVIGAWNAGNIPVLVVHPASVGHGLNLQDGGHTAIWTSLPNYDLELWSQGNKRLHRSGQRNPVVIHVLECPGTIDPGMRAVLDGKATVEQALMDHLESPL